MAIIKCKNCGEFISYVTGDVDITEVCDRCLYEDMYRSLEREAKAKRERRKSDV